MNNDETAEQPGESTDPYAGESTRTLVENLLAQTDWPDPALTEAVLARGPEVYEPVVEFVQKVLASPPIDDNDEDDDTSLMPEITALNLLGSLGDPAAIPHLIAMVRRH